MLNFDDKEFSSSFHVLRTVMLLVGDSIFVRVLARNLPSLRQLLASSALLQQFLHQMCFVYLAVPLDIQEIILVLLVPLVVEIRTLILVLFQGLLQLLLLLFYPLQLHVQGL